MKRAFALLKNKKVLLQGYSETTSGVWVANGPVYASDATQPDQVGRNILDALRQSKRGVPHPGSAEWKAIQAPMLEAAGARTWATLAKGSKAVGLECDGDVVTLIPSSGYENGGGTELSDKALRADLSAENIGDRLMEAFNASPDAPSERRASARPRAGRA